MSDWLKMGVLTAGLLAAPGCSRTTPTERSKPAGPHDHEAEMSEEARYTERLASGAMSPISGTYQPGAAGAVEMALEGFRTGHGEMVFDSLPASYQRDVNGLVHVFAEQVDPELWKRTIAVLDRANMVLRTKKPLLLLAFPHGGDSPVSETWDDLTNAVEELIQGPFGDLERMRQMDVREWLRSDASRMLRRLMTLSLIANPGVPNALNDLSLVQVDLVASGESTARVRISPVNQVNVEPTDFVNIEGKWIPQSLAESWPEAVSRARQVIRLCARDADTPEKRHYRAMLDVYEQVVDQLLQAETSDQLFAAATPLFLQVSQASEEIATPEATLPDGPAEGVSILIRRELSEDELTKLLDMLEPLTDDPEREYHLATANGGKTFVSIKPVHDVAGFAAKLTFGKDPKVDEAARTIQFADFDWK